MKNGDGQFLGVLGSRRRAPAPARRPRSRARQIKLTPQPPPAPKTTRPGSPPRGTPSANDRSDLASDLIYCCSLAGEESRLIPHLYYGYSLPQAKDKNFRSTVFVDVASASINSLKVVDFFSNRSSSRSSTVFLQVNVLTCTNRDCPILTTRSRA